ncbi:putative ribonuclease H-like domain-containing protein [Tanacetum coccineum]
MDLQSASGNVSMRMKNFYKKTGRKLQFDAKELLALIKPKMRNAWNSRNKDGSRTGQKEDSKAIREQLMEKAKHTTKKTQPITSESQSSESDTGESNISTEPSELVSEPVVNESNVECQPKFWFDTPIIEEYESDSEDKCQQGANQKAVLKTIMDEGNSEKEDESIKNCKKRRLNEEAGELHRKKFEQETKNLVIQEGAAKPSSTNIFSTVSTPAKASSTNFVNTVSIPVSTTSPHEGLSLVDPTNFEEDDLEIPPLKDIYQNSTNGIFTTLSYDDEGTVADFTNLETVVNVSPIPTSRIHSSHPIALILGDPTSAVQTKAKQEAGHTMNGVFDSVARLEAIRIFLAFASYMGFIVYQMDVKSAFLYGKIDEEVYVSQPPGFQDPKSPQKVYKVVKALYGLHQAPRAWYATLSTFLLKNGYRRGTIDKTLFLKKNKNDIILVQVYVDDIIFGSTKKSWCDEFEALMKSRFQMSSMGELTFFLGLQVKQKPNGIFISQDKYVDEILKKFDFASVKTASTPIETQKPLVKDEEASDVDVHLYRSMIGSLMYVTTSRPDIMYLKGKPKLGLWYPRESTFDLESYSDSDYAGANLDRKSTTGGCQFLGRRLITWQCKKQTIVATSTTEAEYVAAASCCGQVLWIQNQMLDYGFNFMNTKIYIDNESTICIVKNPVYHSKTKHIAIRHHFIRDAYEKKLIQVLKIHTNDNVADLLTKAFDGKNSLVKHFEDMRLCRPSKEYFQNHTWKRLNEMFIFHEVIDFLQRSYISHTLTVSPVVSTTFVEQFWTSAKSKTINNVRHITAKVAGKVVSISEASIRTDLIFDDADGIDTLPNQAIFDVIQLMGYEGDLTKDYLKNNTPSPAPLVESPNKSLPDSSSAQPSEVPFEQQPDPSPSRSPRPSPNPSPTPIVPDSIPEHTGENLGDHSSNDTSLSGNEDAMTLQNVYDLCLSLCKQEQRPTTERSSSTETDGAEGVVSKQGRKNAKGDGKAKEHAKSEGRTKEIMDEDKEIDEIGLSTEDGVSTDGQRVSTDFEKVSTDKPKLSTDDLKVSTDEQMESNDDQVDASEEIFEGTEDQREGTEEKVESTAEQKESTEEQTKEEKHTQTSQIFHSKTPTSMIILVMDEKQLLHFYQHDEDEDITHAGCEEVKQLESDEVLARSSRILGAEEVHYKKKEQRFFLIQLCSRKFLAQQRSQAIHGINLNKSTRIQIDITYLKHVGNFKHANLKSRKFEDIQALYEKIKRLNEHFISTGSAKDEKFIKRMNEKRVELSKREQRYFSVLTSVLSIFDREDLNAVYQLVMNKYQDEMPEGFERVLWGDLMVLFNPDEKDEYWSSQHEWKVISWKLHSSSGVHTLMTNEGVVIHMLTEKKYPLKKEILVQMLNLKLESEEESTMALELIRFIKKVLADLESKEQD